MTVPYDPAAFGNGGPLQISYSNYYLPISPYSNKGFSKLGFKEIGGFDSGSLIGYSHISDAINPAAAIRSSAESSFLQEALQDVHNTLQVYKRTLALKVLFNGKKASGVRVRTEGQDYTISARKEVILAAGAVSLILVCRLEFPGIDIHHERTISLKRFSEDLASSSAPPP